MARQADFLPVRRLLVMTNTEEEKVLRDRKGDMPKGIRFSLRTYGVLLFLGSIAIIMKLAGWGHADKSLLGEVGLSLFLYSLIIFGIKKRKGWVVRLVLIYAAWMIFGSFLKVVATAATDGRTFAVKVGALLFAIFYAYQIHLFSKKETQRYFQEKNQTVF